MANYDLVVKEPAKIADAVRQIRRFSELSIADIRSRIENDEPVVSIFHEI